MGLAEIQRVLAQLYTHTALRERFLADPQAFGAELGLTPTEIEQVSQLSAQQVTLFANSLHNKRFGEISKLLPLTYKVLGKKLYVVFQQYAETYIPAGIKKHRDDAIHFATFIEHSEKNLDWISEILRYEKAILQAAEITRHVTLYHSRYAIEKLVWSVERGDENLAVVKRPTLVVWLRLFQRSQLKYYRLALPDQLPLFVNLLLKLCCAQ